jgi:hypothetical protein
LPRQRGFRAESLDNDLSHLELLSSLNAELFYGALGYEVEDRAEHALGSGGRMAAVKMHKGLNI